jgi:hypothetical protein
VNFEGFCSDFNKKLENLAFKYELCMIDMEELILKMSQDPLLLVIHSNTTVATAVKTL